MRTTYIIGAGASKAVWGFPVMQDFLADCASQPAGEIESHLREYLEERFGDVQNANLEHVLSDLDNTIHGLGTAWYGSEGHERRLEGLRRQRVLMEVICRRLGVPDAPSTETIAPYHKVLGHLGLGDNIITFNYDAGIEAYAEGRQGEGAKESNPWAQMLGMHALLGDLHPHGPSYGITPDWYQSFLLKLHGSVDFRCCSNSSCPMRPSVVAPDRIHPDNPFKGDFCPVCGADFETVIVPPTMAKSFDRYPKLSFLWRLAERALRESQRIVVWGFSCPTSDHHVRWLLRACRQTEALKAVDVIDLDHEQVKQRLEPLVDPHRRVKWQEFDNHEAYRSRRDSSLGSE